MAEPRDVQKIVLTRGEVSLLKQLRKGAVTESPENEKMVAPLMRAGLAREEVVNYRETRNDRSIPAILKLHITEDGEHYLVYRREQWRRALVTPVIVTVLANILWRLLEWLLPLAVEWLSAIRA